MSTDATHGGHEPKEQSHAVENLDHSECWRLLRGVSVGRLAVWVGDHPDIFPINYKVDHGSLVFRTADGTKLQAATGDTPVALEADGVDPDTGVAWSVVVKGQAAPVQNPQEVLDTIGLLLFPWEAGKKEHFVRITPDTVTGRRFTVAPPLTWWTPLDDATRSGLE
jgi:nitroimidazol reductase NimA-like FMN-containing flavoprotein (pyridoxamine 5'-phosphate oxidase superfamily)